LYISNSKASKEFKNDLRSQDIVYFHVIEHKLMTSLQSTTIHFVIKFLNLSEVESRPQGTLLLVTPGSKLTERFPNGKERLRNILKNSKGLQPWP